jgi:hypothetical protein
VCAGSRSISSADSAVLLITRWELLNQDDERLLAVIDCFPSLMIEQQ